MNRLALFVVAALVLCACGATVGDSCTTQKDCGNQVCITTADYTPGGYCSQQCTLGDDKTCPNGSVCVKDFIAKDFNGCAHTCKVDQDCRGGYGCRIVRDASSAVCVGPNGI